MVQSENAEVGLWSIWGWDGLECEDAVQSEDAEVGTAQYMEWDSVVQSEDAGCGLYSIWEWDGVVQVRMHYKVMMERWGLYSIWCGTGDGVALSEDVEMQQDNSLEVVEQGLVEGRCSREGLITIVMK